MFVDIRENAYGRRKQTQREFKQEYETELAGRVGAAGAKIISEVGKMKNPSPQNTTAFTPPPVPEVSYHVVMFGQSAGPYDLATLKKMVGEGTLKPSSLVWTEGMDDWVEAGKIPAIASIFHTEQSGGDVPPIPPIPNN